jgi:anti-sigma B factor antagonist
MSDLSEAPRLFTTNVGRRSCLEVGGELDLATVDAFRDHLGLLVESGAGDVVVDMAAVTFCDATTLRVLVAADQRLRATCRRVQIVAASAPVVRLLELAGLDTTLLAQPPCGRHTSDVLGAPPSSAHGPLIRTDDASRREGASTDAHRQADLRSDG